MYPVVFLWPSCYPVRMTNYFANVRLRTALFLHLRRGFNFGSEHNGIPAEWVSGMLSDELDPTALMQELFAPKFAEFAEAAIAEYAVLDEDQRRKAWTVGEDTFHNEVYSMGALSLFYGFAIETLSLPENVGVSEGVMNNIWDLMVATRSNVWGAVGHALSPVIDKSLLFEHREEMKPIFNMPTFGSPSWYVFAPLVDTLGAISVVRSDTAVGDDTVDEFDKLIGLYVDAFLKFERFQDRV